MVSPVALTCNLGLVAAILLPETRIEVDVAHYQ
jgi:hypothetical protein